MINLISWVASLQTLVINLNKIISFLGSQKMTNLKIDFLKNEVKCAHGSSTLAFEI